MPRSSTDPRNMTRRPEVSGSVMRRFRGHPSSLHEIRTFVKDRGQAEGLSAETIDDLVLAASEASANAILHTNSRWVDVEWLSGHGAVGVEVRDAGIFERHMPVPELDGHGRGIPLMMAVMDQVSIQEGTPARPGTRVLLLKDRPE
jgi:anti-sigma regulatory factor (Ser/Thr protein kinase)